MGTYKYTDPGPVLHNMAVGRVAVLHYRPIIIAHTPTTYRNTRTMIICENF